MLRLKRGFYAFDITSAHSQSKLVGMQRALDLQSAHDTEQKIIFDRYAIKAKKKRIIKVDFCFVFGQTFGFGKHFTVPLENMVAKTANDEIVNSSLLNKYRCQCSRNHVRSVTFI